MDAELTLVQTELCRKYGSPIVATPFGHKVGVANGVGSAPGVINGLRHPVTSNTSGWYFWPEGNLSNDEDFFQPYHAYHLLELAPSIVRFLSLAPGWRFLIDERNAYEDIWFDPNLLEV